jgi:hypothetical protein
MSENPSSPTSQTTPPSVNLVHSLSDVERPSSLKMKLSLIIMLIIAMGIGSGYLINSFSQSPDSFFKSATLSINPSKNSQSATVREAGIKDVGQFPDSTEGLLEKNDQSITVEGTHRLIRPGGPSQTAYLTSSVVDLSEFENKQVQVMGATYASQKAGWLMDVGWIKVVE